MVFPKFPGYPVPFIVAVGNFSTISLGESLGKLLESGSSVSPAGPTVYIVDDDSAVRHSLEWLLAGDDFAIRTFASAHEFLEAFEPSHPGCLVVDVRMPGMTGLELQRELAARSIDLPVIIITGHSDRQMALKAKHAGAMDFLEKPLDDRVLVKLIHKALGREEPATSETEF